MLESFHSEICKGLIDSSEAQLATRRGFLGYNLTPNDDPLTNHVLSIHNGTSKDNQNGGQSSMLKHRLGCLLQFQNSWAPKASEFYTKLGKSFSHGTDFEESQVSHLMQLMYYLLTKWFLL
jgi:hypothetical protein